MRGILLRHARRLLEFFPCADYQSACPQRSDEDRQQNQEPCAAEQSAEAWRVRARLHSDTEKAEFGAAQSRARAAYQRHRGDDLHPGRRPQPAGALAGAHSRWPCERPPGRALPRRARHARRRWRRGPQARALEVRGKAAQGVTKNEKRRTKNTMPRRRVIAKRELAADPIYQSPLVTRFINTVMRDGKRNTAEGILYRSFDIIKEKTGDDPVKVFKKALDNVKPSLEVKSRRVGGSNYQVPVEVNPNRRLSLSIRWLVGFARARGDGKTMQEKLANELMDAANLRGGAVKKREDTHRMAEANKAFAHYRW